MPETLLEKMADREAEAWVARFGMPRTEAGLREFARGIAAMVGAVHHLAARQRAAVRREQLQA